MSLKPVLATTLLALTLTACGRQDNAPQTSATVASPATPAKASSAQDFQVIPDTLPACDPPAVVTLEWDLTASHPEVKQVEIWVGPDAAPVLFTAMGEKGETKTGQWSAPGSIFRLRDKATGKELARAVIGGPACPPAAI